MVARRSDFNRHALSCPPCVSDAVVGEVGFEPTCLLLYVNRKIDPLAAILNIILACFFIDRVFYELPRSKARGF